MKSFALAAKILISHLELLTEVDQVVSGMDSLMEENVHEGNGNISNKKHGKLIADINTDILLNENTKALSRLR